MNKDRVEGKAKDIAGRAQRQVGEWTGDTESEVKGAAKQVEGKAQNVLGKMKDSKKKSDEETVANQNDNEETESEDRPHRKAS